MKEMLVSFLMNLVNSSLVFVFWLLVLWLGIHLRDKRKKKREEMEKNRKKEKHDEEEAKMHSAREITPRFFSGEEVDPEEVGFIFCGVMGLKTRDKSDAWFQLHSEFFGDVSCEKITSGKVRPFLSFEEFCSWFRMVFNEGYFDSKDLPHGGEMDLSQKFKWASARMRPAAARKADEELIDTLAKQKQFAVEDLLKLRKAMYAELEDMKRKVRELDEVLDREHKAIEEKWKLFSEAHGFSEEWPKLKKSFELAKSDYDAHLKELLKLKKMNFVNLFKVLKNITADNRKFKRALLDIEKWRRDGELGLQVSIDEKTEHFDKMLEQAVEDLRQEHQKTMEQMAESFRQELKAMSDKYDDLKKKTEVQPASHVCNCAKQQEEKKEKSVHWSAELVGILLGIILAAAIFTHIPEIREILRNEDAPLITVPIVEVQDDLLHDSDLEIPFIEEDIPAWMYPPAEKKEEDIRLTEKTEQVVSRSKALTAVVIFSPGPKGYPKNPMDALPHLVQRPATEPFVPEIPEFSIPEEKSDDVVVQKTTEVVPVVEPKAVENISCDSVACCFKNYWKKSSTEASYDERMAGYSHINTCLDSLKK